MQSALIYKSLSYDPLTSRYERDNLRSDETANECTYCNTGYSGNSGQFQVMLEHGYP